MNRKITVAAAVLFACAGLLPGQALAAEVRPGESVVVGPAETIDDDLYAFGRTVTILGTVNGSVFAAGEAVTVAGPVSGDVSAAGNTVSVTGQVKGSLRAAGGTVTLAAPVTRDLLAAGGTIGTAANGSVGRDVLVAGGSSNLAGAVGRNVSAAGGELVLAGPVGGNVSTDVQRLTVDPRASVGGELRYVQREQANIAAGARIGRVVRAEAPQAAPEVPPGPGAGVVGWLRGLTGAAALGVLFVVLFPAFASRAAGTIASSPFASLGLGAGELVGGPILALLVFGLGIVLGGWWLGLAVLGVYGALVSVGYVVAALALGWWVMARIGQSNRHRIWAPLVGVVLLGLAGVVPILGGLVIALAALLGVGALSIALVRAYREANPSGEAAVPREVGSSEQGADEGPVGAASALHPAA